MRLIAVALAMLHMADGVVTGLSHHHADSSCARGHVAAGRLGHSQACDHRHAAHGQKAQVPLDGQNNGTSLPFDDNHDCAACRHLARPLMHALAMPEATQTDLCAIVSSARPIRLAGALLLTYHSRAPPGSSA